MISERLIEYLIFTKLFVDKELYIEITQLQTQELFVNI